MNTVTVNMTDLFTGEKVSRTIDKTNAMKSGEYGWFLGDEESQKKSLERWISERANEQHDTWLELNSWTFA